MFGERVKFPDSNISEERVIPYDSAKLHERVMQRDSDSNRSELD